MVNSYLFELVYSVDRLRVCRLLVSGINTTIAYVTDQYGLHKTSISRL